MKSKSFAQLCADYRSKAKLTKTAVADHIDTSSVYVLRIENGQTIPPTFDICQKMATLFELSPNETEVFLKQAFLERIKDNAQFYKHLEKPLPSLAPASSDPIMSIPLTHSQCTYLIELKRANTPIMSDPATLQKTPELFKKIVTDFNYTLHECVIEDPCVRLTISTSPNINIQEYVVGIKQFCTLYITNAFPDLKKPELVWLPTHFIQTLPPQTLKKKQTSHTKTHQAENVK